MSKVKPQNKDYERLGKMLVDVSRGDIRPAKGFYKTAFLRGIATGFGGVVGATVVVALLLWVLSFFDSIPIIGGFVDSIQSTIDQQ